MRQQISKEAQKWAMERVRLAMERRLKEKGEGTFASSHEVLGIIAEEYDELIDAVRANDMTKVDKELEDIAVACVFAMSCIEEEGLEW